MSSKAHCCLRASTLDVEFGQVCFVEGAAPSLKAFTLTNEDDGGDNTAALHVIVSTRVLPNVEFPARLQLIDLEELGVSCVQEVDVYALEAFLQDVGQLDIVLQPREMRTVLAVLLPVVPTGVARTSFFSVSSQLCLRTVRADGGDCGGGELNLAVSAVFCTPILYADETDIDFEHCCIGETYVRDIQLWNRSEVPLFYRIVPLSEEDLSMLVFSDFDSGRILAYSAPQKIASFASRRIRIMFRSSRLGDAHAVFHVDNVLNPANKLVLECRVNVIDEGESDVLVEDIGTSAPVGAGRVLHFGDCYADMDTLRRTRISNRSKQTLLLQLHSDSPAVVLFRILDLASSSASWSSSSSSSSSSLSSSQSLLRARERVGRDALDVANPNFRPIPPLKLPYTSLIGTGGTSLMGDMYDEHEHESSRRQQQQRAQADDDDDAAAPTSLRYQEAPSSSLAIDAWTTGSKQVDKVKLHSSYDVAAYFARNVCSAFGELPDKPGGLFSRGHARRGTTSAAKPDSRTLLSKRPPGPVTAASDARQTAPPFFPSAARSSPPPLCSCSAVIVLSPGASIVAELCLHPKSRVHTTHHDAGSLVTITSKLTLLWTSKITAELPIFTHSLTIQCKARVCQSIISVTPAALDLGECSVGEFRAAVFSVHNNSDLAALVLPFVESETLGVMDAEVSIPPRQTRQVRLEYVARLENTDYKRGATFFNAFNSYGNVEVEVKAKNVDTHQVLLHSLFYSLITRNTRRQLQIDMGNVLSNIPNLRTFSIRNIYSEPLTLEITADETALISDQFDLKIFFLRSTSIIGGSNYSDGNGNGNGNGRTPTRASVLEESESERSSRLRSIEDLKWGAGNKNPSNRRLSASGVASISSFDDGTGGVFKGPDKGLEPVSTPEMHEGPHALSVDALLAKKPRSSFTEAEDPGRPEDAIGAGSPTAAARGASSATPSSDLISRFDNADFPLNLLGLRFLHDAKDGPKDKDKDDEGRERDGRDKDSDVSSPAKPAQKSFQSIYSESGFADEAVRHDLIFSCNIWHFSFSGFRAFPPAFSTAIYFFIYSCIFPSIYP